MFKKFFIDYWFNILIVGIWMKSDNLILSTIQLMISRQSIFCGKWLSNLSFRVTDCELNTNWKNLNHRLRILCRNHTMVLNFVIPNWNLLIIVGKRSLSTPAYMILSNIITTNISISLSFIQVISSLVAPLTPIRRDNRNCRWSV